MDMRMGAMFCIQLPLLLPQWEPPADGRQTSAKHMSFSAS